MRQHNRKGARSNKNYPQANLQKCLQQVKNGRMSQRRACEFYKVPRSTLQRKLKPDCRIRNVLGRPPVLTVEEEQSFVDHILALSEYGFPLTCIDLRHLVKAYLDSNDRKVNIFKNNIPGEDWSTSFLKRHPILTRRIAANIKRARAKVSPEVIEEYFINVEEELEGVPPENIWNFDETNVTDDPGAKMVICERGTKYPERIMNSSKGSISLMFCGNAAGDLMSPYVVYRADHLWDSWCVGGPAGTRYNRTTSGWFDLTSFEDWFEHVALPILRKLKGKKVLVGDNLSSHISQRVLQLCKKHNISFVALPPNSTHLTQPLDVSFFRPLKLRWRAILNEYRLKNGNKLVTKDKFPRLLKKLTEAIGMKKNESLINGFKKCGLEPVDRNAVLNRMPVNHSEIPVLEDSVSSRVGESVLQYLSKERYGDDENTSTTRRKKLAVPAGKGISEDDVLPLLQRRKGKRKLGDNGQLNRDEESCPPVPKKKKSKKCTTINSTKDGENNVQCQSNESNNHLPYDIGGYVIVEYEQEYFPGRVINVNKSNGSAEVSAMVMQGVNWAWPEAVDQMWYAKNKVIEVIREPKLKLSKSRDHQRQVYQVPELVKYRK